MKPIRQKPLIGISTIVLILIYLLIISNLANAQPDEDCGFSLRLDRLQRLRETSERPTLSGPVVNINTTHFKIHYTLSGDDATTPAWAESIAVYAEHCWSTLSNLGWVLPPPDGGLGGDDRYDIYVRNTVDLGYYGSTNPESPYRTPYPDGYTSWIDIHKDSITQPFPKFARLRALVAHEFHHACQMRYSWREQNWFYENTSVYIEDVIYDDVNTLVFRFTQGVDPLDSPHLPISYKVFPYQYAGGIWPTFLHENFGSTAPLRAWERMGEVSGENTLSGIDWALQTYFSSNLTSALKKYALWRYFTGTRADAYHFSEANLWPTSTVLRTHSIYPASGNQSSSNPSGPGGTNFIEFTSGTGSLDLTFDGQDGYTWDAYAISYRAPSVSTESEISLNANGYGTITIPWSENDHIVLVPIMAQWTSFATNLTYTYTATLSPLIPVKFTNKISSNNAGGLLLLDGIDTVISGNSRNLLQASTHHIRTLNERFVFDSIFKHNNWNGIVSKFRLGHNFTVQLNTPQDANFIGLNPATIRTEFLEAPQVTGGTIQFRDPWYLHSDGRQPDSLFTWPSPHHPTGAYNQTTGGVFLNQVPDQNDPTKPYYSVKADAVQYIHLPHTGRVYPFYFQGWSSSPDGSAEFQNANALETPVVFKNPGAVVSANYKGTQLSNNKNAFSNNSQRKFVRSNYNRMLHVVYESMGKIWYETSTDNGITWQIRNGGKSLSNTEAKNPSIFIIDDVHTHSAVAIVFQERNGDFYNIKALTYSTYSDSIMDVSLIKTVLKPYSENANPVIAFGHNIIVVWQEGYGNYWEPQGLYYVYGEIRLGYKFRWTDTTYLHYPFTDTNTENVNPTISRVDDVPINIFHLAWEARNRARGTSDIMFCKITSYNNVTIINDVMNISYGNGFRYNHSPSIISVKDNDRKEFAIVCWIGEREDWPNSINPQMQKQVILTSTSRPGIFKVFGENVSSVSINKSSTRWTVGWSRSNDLPLQYTDSRGVSIYQLDVYGEYIQIGDGILPEQMYALAFNTRALPYTINTKQIYPQYIPTEVISTTKLREGVVSKDGVQIYYSIGDIKVGNEKIDFIEMPDTVKINTLQDANYYLMSEPFELDDNSEFYYTIKFGISDTNAVKQALSENEFINFSVELIDAITNELIGVLNEVTYDQHNVAQYNEVSYQVNTSGIGNRVVRLRLVITNNIDPHYAISDKYFDESVSLAKRQIKQINYKGKLEIKDYTLYQNYPNPFNPVTKIRFSIKETNPVKIKLYDIVGREVAVIMNEVKDAGEYEIELDAGKLGISSGVYFYQMKAGDYTSIKKMVYLK